MAAPPAGPDLPGESTWMPSAVKVTDNDVVRNKGAHLAAGSTWTGSSTSWHLGANQRMLGN